MMFFMGNLGVWEVLTSEAALAYWEHKFNFRCHLHHDLHQDNHHRYNPNTDVIDTKGRQDDDDDDDNGDAFNAEFAQFTEV